jgi:biopolymer transport protein ExbB
MMVFGTANATTTATASTAATTVVTTQNADQAAADADVSFHQGLKKRFIEGGPGFMGIVLLCLILGLAIAIERIIFLNLSTTNTKKLTKNVEDALASGGVEAAKEVCRKSCCSLRWCANGTIREKRILDLIIYRTSTNAWFHGYSNRDDSSL